MKKLSPTMEKALEAIKAGGGVAHPEGGGWWRGRNGRLSYPVDDYRETATVTTNTIYALVDRGLMEPVPNSGDRWHNRSYRLVEGDPS